MSIHFQFRRYRLPLRTTVRTAHVVWIQREGLIIRVEGERGAVGFGEVAPIPAFGTETIDEAGAACEQLGEWPDEARLNAIPSTLGCVRHALGTALAQTTLSGGHAGSPAQPTTAYRSVAALLPAGRAAVEALRGRADAGFRTFKWKVGVGDAADEIALLDDVCAVMPEGARLRLDANGAWDRRIAERWLERCAERPVEFVEQPCAAPARAGESVRRRTDDLLLGLANDYPTPLALDEALVGDGDVERWIAAGWPGWYVVKPSLLGDVETALARLREAKATVVFSSALETAIGARAALRTAFAWTGEPKALGFGVWPLFADPRFDGPAAAPFVRVEDVERLNPEAIWTALD